MVLGDEKGRGPPLSRMALAPAGLQPDAAEWSGATGGNASAVLERVTWENDEQAGGWVLPLRRWQRACLVRPSALDCHCSRRRRLLSMLVPQGERPHCRVTCGVGRFPGFLADKRVSVQFSRTYWQTNEFRSSRNTPCASHGTFLEEYEASNGTFLTHSVVLTTELRAVQGWMASRFRNHYSETRFAAIGDPETTPKRDLLPARP